MEQASADANDVLKKMGVPPDVRASLIQPFDTLIAKFRENNTLAANLKQRMEELPTGTKTFTYKVTYETYGNKPVPTGATGGLVTGPGTGTSDSVAAALSNGEFVMQSSIVDRFGVGFFAKLNAGINPLAGMTPSLGAGSSGLQIGTINVNAAPGERAETSLPRALRRAAFLAGVNG